MATQTLQDPKEQHLTGIITVTWKTTWQWTYHPGLSLLPFSFGGWSSSPILVHQKYKGSFCWEGTEQGYLFPDIFSCTARMFLQCHQGKKTHWKSWLNSSVNIIKLLLNHTTSAKFEAQTTKLVYQLYADYERDKELDFYNSMWANCSPAESASSNCTRVAKLGA